MGYRQKLYNFFKKLKDVVPNILYRLTISDATKFKIIKTDITQTEWNLIENWKRVFIWVDKTSRPYEYELPTVTRTISVQFSCYIAINTFYIGNSGSDHA